MKNMSLVQEERQARRKEIREAGLVSISFSALNRGCPYFTAAEALGIEGKRPPSPELEVGQFYHEKIQEYLLTGEESALEGLSKTARAGIKRLAPTIKAMGPVLSVEEEYALIREEKKYILHGYTDITVADKNAGLVSIIDIKTFSQAKEVRKKEREQMKFYAPLVAQSAPWIKQVATYIYRAKAGKLLFVQTWTREELEEILNREIIPEADKFAEKVRYWIEQFKKGEAEAKPGSHCHICPHIFSCPLLKKIPETLEEIAARYIVEREITNSLKEVIGMQTVEVGDFIVGPKITEYEVIGPDKISHILKLIAQLEDPVERELLLGELSTVLSPISSTKIKKADAIIEKIAQIVAKATEKEISSLGLQPETLHSTFTRTYRAEVKLKEEEEEDGYEPF